MATTAGNDALKEQFLQLQEQQRSKLERRKQLKKEREKTITKENPPNPSFGVSDNLDLQLAEPPKDSAYSEELVQHLNDQIRELKDETGRLYKLLSERDLEVRQLKKKRKEEAAAGLDSGPVASEAAASKIVELSKKLRETTAELESERTRSKTLSKKCKHLESQVEKNGPGDKTARSSLIEESTDNKNDNSQELKMTQEKLKQAEFKLAEFRNQSASLKQELKVAYKVLASEVGEGVNIQSLLNSPSGWRGRQQQITNLQKKVSDLKAQVGNASQVGSMSSLSLGSGLEAELMGTTSSRRPTLDDKHRDQIRRMEKERREAQEKAAGELKALEEDYSAMKTKWDASKSRNKVLAAEVKSLKQQLQTCLEKGRHDDELLEALMKQQSQLKDMLETATKTQRSKEQSHEEQVREMSLRKQQENNIVEQLKAIAAEKEAKVKTLEEEIMVLKKMNMQKAQNAWLINHEHSKHGGPGQTERPLSGRSDLLSSRLSSNTPIVEVLDERVDTMASRQSNRSASRQSVLSDLTDRPASGRSSKQHIARGINREMEELRMQVREFQGLYQAAAVERDKLSELVALLQTRLEESTQQVIDTKNELQIQKRRNVELEKQVGKTRAEQSAAKSGRKARSKVDLEEDAETRLGADSLEEVQTNLAIQRDENAALKVALTSTLKAKEEDLRLYQQIMQQTREVFLQGLRQYKTEKSVDSARLERSYSRLNGDS